MSGDIVKSEDRWMAARLNTSNCAISLIPIYEGMVASSFLCALPAYSHYLSTRKEHHDEALLPW